MRRLVFAALSLLVAFGGAAAGATPAHADVIVLEKLTHVECGRAVQGGSDVLILVAAC